jgi:type II secretory pathway component PulF
MSFEAFMLRSSFAGERSEFYRDLASALASGTKPFKDWLEETVVAETRNGKIGRRGKVCQAMLANLAVTNSAASALMSMVPPSDAMTLQAFDAVVSKSLLLNDLADSIENISEQKFKVGKAMAMPLLSVAILFALFAFFGSELVPLIARSYPISKWPASCVYFYHTSTFLAGKGGVGVLIAIAISLPLLVWSFANWTGPLRRFCDEHIFPFTLVRSFVATNFLMTYGLMLQHTPAPNERAIANAISANSSKWLRSCLDRVAQNLAVDAENLGDAFDVGLLPRGTLSRFKSYVREGSGNLGPAVRRVATDNFKKESRLLEKLFTKVSLVSMAFVGAGVLWSISGYTIPMQKMAKEAKQRGTAQLQPSIPTLVSSKFV